MLEIVCVVSFVAIALCLSSIKFLKDYERLVIFRFGRASGQRGPGPQIVWPFLETYRKVDLRIITLPVGEHELSTRDNVSVKASAVCYYQVADAQKAVLHVEDFRDATENVAQSVLKDVLGTYELNELTSVNKRISKTLRAGMESSTSSWGIRITDISYAINVSAVTSAEPIVSEAQMVAAAELPSEPTDELVASPFALARFSPDQAARAVLPSPQTAPLTAKTTPALPAAETASTLAAAVSDPINRQEAVSSQPGKSDLFLSSYREGIGDGHLEPVASSHHKQEHQAYHRKHKHTHFFDHDSYDFGSHSYEFGHEKKKDSSDHGKEELV